MGTKTILVIDDNEIILKMLEGVLNKVGYKTELAHNGREGLEMLKDKSFDLVITDVMMPYASGFEVISRLRQQLEERPVPIIVISSITQEESAIDSFNLGADEYIRKPIMMRELLVKIKKLLARGS